LPQDAPRELGEVRLAEEDRAGVEDALNRDRVPFRHVVLVELRPVRRADAGRFEEVLDGQRAAGERAGHGDAGLHPGDERVPGVVVHDGMSATASISTFAPGTASRGTSTSVDAGRASPKTSCRSGLISGRSSASVR
jgi:hypothetical protein